ARGHDAAHRVKPLNLPGYHGSTSGGKSRCPARRPSDNYPDDVYLVWFDGARLAPRRVCGAVAGGGQVGGVAPAADGRAARPRRLGRPGRDLRAVPAARRRPRHVLLRHAVPPARRPRPGPRGLRLPHGRQGEGPRRALPGQRPPRVRHVCRRCVRLQVVRAGGKRRRQAV
ncbi:MAG: hypothetical protein AVDCRST_MAG64-3529, partial [uncultured Phycisphaerae bacterium]